MGESVLLDNALRIPAPDVEALIQGRVIAAMPRKFINPGAKFVLYPADTSINSLPDERHYRSIFLPITQTAIAHLGSETVLIKAWARCELCQILNDPKSLNALSRLTIWTTEGLQQTLLQRPRIFVAHLRVYLLPQPLEVPVHNQERQFVPLPHSLSVTESSPVLSDRIFAQRRRQLEKLEPPLHPELEGLESAIAQLNNPSAQQLAHKIRQFLGWTSQTHTQPADPKLAWIQTIADLGDRSKELDEKKSNYQAGTDFENIVRQSLEFLGFTVDEAYKGGAGGLDLFCSKPYPLVGECKAGKGIPSRSAEELIKLGGMRLDDAQFQTAAKLIIGPGKPSKDVLTASQKFRISIINPMTLQKLVELEAKYPGSVNLITLKEYLEPGQIDYRIDEYIQKVESDVKLRSQIVQAVKQLGDPGSEHLTVEIRVQYNAVYAKEPIPKLDDLKVHDLLVELSSPLTGYLGRKKGRDGSDRFYFLRDLQID
ncbi:MAG TPA: DUF1802 family protein [Allocoleopsis sp.]